MLMVVRMVVICCNDGSLTDAMMANHDGYSDGRDDGSLVIQ